VDLIPVALVLRVVLLDEVCVLDPVAIDQRKAIDIAFFRDRAGLFEVHTRLAASRMAGFEILRLCPHRRVATTSRALVRTHYWHTLLGAVMTAAVDPSIPPSGIGCAECDAVGGWWVHLRRCASCGHIGCCDDSLATHATKHWRETGHPIIRSFEPGEDWFWNYETNDYYEGPELAPPECHPEDQTVPGPRGRVPRNWAELLRQRDG
jgi:hypothetical protein